MGVKLVVLKPREDVRHYGVHFTRDPGFATTVALYIHGYEAGLTIGQTYDEAWYPEEELFKWESK